MAWFSKKRLFSPRAVVQAREIGPNTIRYERIKPSYDNQDVDEIENLNSKSSIEINNVKEIKSSYPSYPSYGNYYDDDFLISSHDYNHGLRRKATYSSYPETSPYKVPNKQVKKKSDFTWSPSRWSSFGFSSFYGFDSDDNTKLYVKEPESYITPTNDEIKSRINAYSRDALETIKEAARVCYFKMIDEKDYINPNYLDSSDVSHKKKKVLYDSIYDTFIPGFTPLEQAISIWWQQNDIQCKIDSGKKLHPRYIKHVAEFNREDYSDPDVNRQLDKNLLSQKHSVKIINNISIIGDLGYQFKVEKDIGEKEVSNSEKTKTRILSSYEELTKIDIYQRILPNFNSRFITKDLMVNIPVESSEKKQKIIILCDFSGSMNSSDKQIWVNSLLIDRFKYVIKGEAEIFFSKFVSCVTDLHFQHIKNEEDVNSFWDNFSNNPNGSMTNIGRIVNHISDEIEDKRLCNLDIDLSNEKPEILIINDGQDRVGYKEFPYKVNAISLMQFSEELKELCIASGGKQMRVREDNSVVSYCKGPSGSIEEEEVA